jgi:rod shape-determining protein MreD
MATFISIPIFAALLVLQTAIISRIPLLHGTADLVLLVILAWALQKRVQTAWQWGIIGGLMVGIVTALPFGTSLICYLLAVAMALALRQRVWQVPILAMFVATFFGTLLTHVIAVLSLRFFGDQIPIGDAFSLVTLPSILLNLLLAIPAYALLSDLAHWLYPEELEV